ncbi:hypothetical protein [Burkholderia sp. Ac-20353]|nr:hypothetical protein [Burkholderia sp. Ac-20353]
MLTIAFAISQIALGEFSHPRLINDNCLTRVNQFGGFRLDIG